MKNEREKIIHFELKDMQGISVTHGYNISNAFPVHFHSTYNLGIIELGEREFSYRGIKTVLKQNDIFIVQPFEPHSCKSYDNSSHSYKIISFDLDTSCYFPQLVIYHPDLLGKIREFHALAEYENSSSGLMSLYDEIIRQLKTCSLEHNSAVLDEETSSRIRLAKQFIERNCQLDISLKEMSDIACLSEFYFNRFFHKCYGLSPYAYYLVCKMKKSQKVLIKQKSVIETTYDIGFFDQSHFTRHFKKYVGVTPGKYLRDNKNYK
jgi:AraC-like DNA-binding protein